MGLYSRLAGAAVVVFTCLTVTPLAYADDSTAIAEQLFQEGLAAMKRGDFPVACEAFAQSNKADPSAGTMNNLAFCYEKQKKWASAWSSYRLAVGLAEKQKNAERQKSADDAATRIRPQIHYIIISVKESLTDLIVKRDGEPIPITLAGKENPVPIDPGEHSLEVSAHAKKPYTVTLKIPDNNATERVEIPKLPDAPEDKSAPSGGNGGSDYHPPIIVSNDGSGQRTVGIIVGGAGLLAALTCGGMFILANNEASARNKQRTAATNDSDPTQKAQANAAADSHNKAALNDQLIALIFGGGAVVLVGVGVVLYFTAPKAGAEKTAAKAPRPYVAPVPLLGSSFGGLGLTGAF